MKVLPQKEKTAFAIVFPVMTVRFQCAFRALFICYGWYRPPGQIAMAESEYCHPEGNVDGTLSRGHESYSDGTSVVYCNDMMAWHIAQIKDALHITVKYSGKYFTSFGAASGVSDGFGNVLTFNHGIWHQVCPGITLK